MDKIQELNNLKRIRKISKILDSAIGIPGTKFRIGLDPILGLIPGGGDLIAAIISGYTIFLAARLGLGKEDLGQMLKNIALETIIGTVPLVGDIFDAYFKANLRNLEIIEEGLAKLETEAQQKERQPQSILIV